MIWYWYCRTFAVFFMFFASGMHISLALLAVRVEVDERPSSKILMFVLTEALEECIDILLVDTSNFVIRVNDIILVTALVFLKITGFSFYSKILMSK